MTLVAWKEAPVVERASPEQHRWALRALIEACPSDKPIHFSTVVEYNTLLGARVVHFVAKVFA
jgi:hypothetical protein